VSGKILWCEIYVFAQFIKLLKKIVELFNVPLCSFDNVKNSSIKKEIILNLFFFSGCRLQIQTENVKIFK